MVSFSFGSTSTKASSSSSSSSSSKSKSQQAIDRIKNGSTSNETRTVGKDPHTNTIFTDGKQYRIDESSNGVKSTTKKKSSQSLKTKEEAKEIDKIIKQNSNNGFSSIYDMSKQATISGLPLEVFNPNNSFSDVYNNYLTKNFNIPFSEFIKITEDTISKKYGTYGIDFPTSQNKFIPEIQREEEIRNYYVTNNHILKNDPENNDPIGQQKPPIPILPQTPPTNNAFNIDSKTVLIIGALALVVFK
jgi:hypothetical protein